jgi:hypothetical protein
MWHSKHAMHGRFYAGRKRPLTRFRRKKKDNIEVNIEEIGRICGKDSCGARAVLKTWCYCQFYKKERIFFFSLSE